MPQLDKVTYLTQLFWLIFFFIGFYIISSKFILPTISKILKIRKKQIQYNNNEIIDLKKEESSILKNYEKILTNSLTESRELLAKTSESSLTWLNESLIKVNKSTLLQMNKEYIKIVGEIIGQKHLLSLHIKGNKN